MPRTQQIRSAAGSLLKIAPELQNLASVQQIIAKGFRDIADELEQLAEEIRRERVRP